MKGALLLRNGFLSALLALVAASCDDRRTGSTSAPQARGSVTALVAASTNEAVEEIASLFTKVTGIAVKISSGPSNTLATQILEGAPADVFLSASQEWADAVKAQDAALEVRPLLTNDLVVVVPKGSPVSVKSPRDLASDRVKRLALASENVPAGKYAEQALRALKLYDGLVRDKKVVRGQDVRLTLAYVERGEAEAGVVYATDAQASANVETAFPFDPSTFDKIIYPIVLLKAAEANASAKSFYAFLASQAAASVFEKRGFRRLP